MTTPGAELSFDLRTVVRGVRQTQAADLVELRSLRDRYRRQIEYYRDIPGGECPPAVDGDAAQAAALETAWQACQGAYRAWQAAYERWEALRTGA